MLSVVHVVAPISFGERCFTIMHPVVDERGNRVMTAFYQPKRGNRFSVRKAGQENVEVSRGS